MKTTINIPKRASGAQKNSIGDGTLFYTGDVSEFNKSLSGWFIDNPPTLSQHHASLVWRYNRGYDRYILIHVQGSQVSNEAMGRYYPFRAGYEVSRDDMNKIDFSLTSLFAAVPRIATMTYGRMDLETEVENKLIMPSGPNSSTLAHNIEVAIVSGRRLMVEISPKADSWRDDGIFDCMELDTVLTAIDSLDIKLRRYASFAFCVDEHFEVVLDGVPVIFYCAGSAIKRRPDDISMTWLEAVTLRAELSPVQARIAKVFPYPGANEPLMEPEDLLRSYSVFAKDVSALESDEWDTWLMLGHQLTEVMPTSWKQFKSYYTTMPGAVRGQFAIMVHDNSLKWNVEELTQELFAVVNGAQAYTEKEMAVFQRKVLQEYLEDGHYGFIFPNGVPDEMLKGLNAKYLESLNLTSLEQIEKWYGIFSKLNRLEVPGVAEAFGHLLKPHAARLTDLKKITAFMSRYPFVPLEAYRKPERITSVPSTRGLSEKQEALVKSWVDEAVRNYQFKDLKALNEQLAKINDGEDTSSLLAESLRNMDETTLMSLLQGTKKDSQIGQIENLLDRAKGMTQYWSGFKDIVKPTVMEFLFGEDGRWAPRHLLDVKNWDAISSIEESSPKVYKLITEAFGQTLESTSLDDIDKVADSVAKYYEPLEDGSAVREPNQLVELFVDYLKKQDNEKAKVLKDMLKLSSRRGRGIMVIVLTALAGLILGGLLGFYVNHPKDSDAESNRLYSLVKFVPQDNQKNIMLLLATLPDSINAASLDSLTISMDSVRKSLYFLQEWNKASLESVETMDSARLSLSPLNEGEVVLPAVPNVISKQFSLYDLMVSHNYKIDTISVYGKKTVIPIPSDSLLGNQAVTSLPTDYYFKVISYIDSCLPEDKKIKLPY